MATILVIDDDPGFRRMVSLVLSRARHVVIDADGGDKGVERFKAERPNLVISDIVMPGKEGIETIREIRALSPTLPIIAMSGGSANIGLHYLDVAQKLGASAILSKPFRPVELVDLVDSLLKTVADRGAC